MKIAVQKVIIEQKRSFRDRDYLEVVRIIPQTCIEWSKIRNSRLSECDWVKKRQEEKDEELKKRMAKMLNGMQKR